MKETEEEYYRKRNEAYCNMLGARMKFENQMLPIIRGPESEESIRALEKIQEERYK